MCEHDYPQCWFTLRLVLAKRRYRCVREPSFLGLCERRTDERVSCTRTEKINCVCNIVLNPIRWVGRSSSRQINHVDSQYIFLNGGRRRVAPSWLVEGGAVLVVHPSLLLRLRDRRRGFWTVRCPRAPAFFTVVHAIDSCFRKFFLFFPGGVGGGLSAGFLRPCTKCPENFLFFLWLVCGGELQQVTCDTARRRSVTERQ